MSEVNERSGADTNIGHVRGNRRIDEIAPVFADFAKGKPIHGGGVQTKGNLVIPTDAPVRAALGDSWS